MGGSHSLRCCKTGSKTKSKTHSTDNSIQIRHWASFAGWDWLKSSGVFYGKSDMNDEAVLYARSNAAPFEKLRTWAFEHETLINEDTETYLKAVSYLGLMYKGIATNLTAAMLQRAGSWPCRRFYLTGGQSCWKSAGRERYRSWCKSWLAET
jgi:hypothetical protein